MSDTPASYGGELPDLTEEERAVLDTAEKYLARTLASSSGGIRPTRMTPTPNDSSSSVCSTGRKRASRSLTRPVSAHPWCP